MAHSRGLAHPHRWFSTGSKVKGKVYAFGGNHLGQLGLADTKATSKLTPLDVGDLADVRGVACGLQHSLVWGLNGDKEHKVYVAGQNNSGQLGVGDVKQRDEWTEVPHLDGKVVQAAAAGASHSVVLMENQEIYGFGSNALGQLGLGDNATTIATRYNSSKDATVLTPRLLPVVEGTPHISNVQCGLDFTGFFSATAGHLWVCGWNCDGQLGQGTPESPEGPDPPLILSPKPLLVNGLGAIMQVISGGDTTLVQTGDGWYAWGNGEYAQTGVGKCLKHGQHLPTALGDDLQRLVTQPGNAAFAGMGTTMMAFSGQTPESLRLIGGISALEGTNAMTAMPGLTPSMPENLTDAQITDLTCCLEACMVALTDKTILLLGRMMPGEGGSVELAHDHAGATTRVLEWESAPDGGKVTSVSLGASHGLVVVQEEVVG
eukprot:Clim_evm9s238 gene=Clim_evmTU9s238